MPRAQPVLLKECLAVWSLGIAGTAGAACLFWGSQAQPVYSGAFAAWSLGIVGRTQVWRDAVGMEVDVSAHGEFETDHLAAGLDDAVVRARAEFQDGEVVFGGDPDVDQVGLALAEILVKLIAVAGVFAVGGFVGVREFVVDGGGPGWVAGS